MISNGGQNLKGFLDRRTLSGLIRFLASKRMITGIETLKAFGLKQTLSGLINFLVLTQGCRQAPTLGWN
jgi:hypothetical protein